MDESVESIVQRVSNATVWRIVNLEVGNERSKVGFGFAIDQPKRMNHTVSTCWSTADLVNSASQKLSRPYFLMFLFISKRGDILRRIPSLHESPRVSRGLQRFSNRPTCSGSKTAFTDVMELQFVVTLREVPDLHAGHNFNQVLLTSSYYVLLHANESCLCIYMNMGSNLFN